MFNPLSASRTLSLFIYSVGVEVEDAEREGEKAASLEASPGEAGEGVCQGLTAKSDLAALCDRSYRICTSTVGPNRGLACAGKARGVSILRNLVYRASPSQYSQIMSVRQ